MGNRNFIMPIAVLGFFLVFPSDRVSAAESDDVAANTKIERPLVGAIRWDGWNAWDVWQRSFDSKEWHYRLPFYGKIGPDGKAIVRGDSQEVMDQEIAYAKAGGLDYWVFNWYNPAHKIPDTAVAPAPADAYAQLNRAFRLYLSSKHKSDINYALLIEGGNALVPEEKFSQTLDHFVKCFQDSNYQKVMDGRPLVYFLGMNGFITTLGSEAAVRKTLDDLRGRSIAAGAGNPYFVLMTFAPKQGAELLDELGCDALSAYCSYSHVDPSELSVTVWVANVKIAEIVADSAGNPKTETILREWKFQGRNDTDNPFDGVTLRSDADNTAKMSVDPDIAFPGGRGALKVAFADPTGSQLYFGAGREGLNLVKGKKYTVSFQLKISKRKTFLPISASVATDASPSAPLGAGAGSQSLAVGTEWKEFKFVFSPNRDFHEDAVLRIPEISFTKAGYLYDHGHDNKEFPYALLAAANQRFWKDCKATGKQVIPIVNAGWDYRPMKQPQYKWLLMCRTMDANWYTEATPKELADNVKTAMDWVTANPSTCPSKAVLIYAWNELSEGGWLVPTLTQGTAKLDALGTVLREQSR